MRSLLLSASRALYSQPAKQNIFKVPQRHFIQVDALNKLDCFLSSAESVKILAVAFKVLFVFIQDNIDYFTETHVNRLYEQIRIFNLEIDSSFHQVIAPITIEYVKAFNRENSLTLGNILLTLAQLRIDNQPLREALLEKLDKENVYKYIPLGDSVILLNALLSNPEYAGTNLVRKLLAVIQQNKAYFDQVPLYQSLLNQIYNQLDAAKTGEPQLSAKQQQLE